MMRMYGLVFNASGAQTSSSVMCVTVHLLTSGTLWTLACLPFAFQEVGHAVTQQAC